MLQVSVDCHSERIAHSGTGRAGGRAPIAISIGVAVVARSRSGMGV